MTQVALAELVPSGWRDALRGELADPSFAALATFLEQEEREARVFPPRSRLFAALELTPLEAVKVVLLGQDPYPTEGNANGLAFSVNPGVKLPASLRNLFAGLRLDVGVPEPASGDLSAWASRGVLLLNTVLSVREGQPNSHRRRGWEGVTTGVLRRVSEREERVVFLCLGKQAEAVALRFVDRGRHELIVAPHPSPLNGRAFVEAAARDRPFTRVAEALRAAGRSPVDWHLGGSAGGAVSAGRAPNVPEWC